MSYPWLSPLSVQSAKTILTNDTLANSAIEPISRSVKVWSP